MRRALALTLALLSLPAMAGGSLYDPAPPEGSAFVRIFNASGAARSELGVGGGARVQLEVDAASPYLVVPEGSRTAALGGGLTQAVDVSAGSFLTIALLPSADGVEPLILKDKPNTNLARARVTLYNLSAAPEVDLKLADGSQDVIADVTPRQTGERVVNALTVDLAVYAGETQIKALPGVTLERGGSYSVFVTGAADALSAAWVTDTTKGP